jgi:N6-adenosine-specific RNA methylase IME4
MKKYNIIYADPPWQFKTYSDKGKGRAPEKHYNTMSKTDIQQLNISSISADNAVLFLWVTFPCLKEGLELIEKWGFAYKTCAFNWVKRNKRNTNTWFWGLGYWTRANSEICLLATKGNISRVSKSVHQIIESPIEAHSKKPEETKSRIVQLMGDLPRIELFARQQTDGWDVWGNEVETDIVLIH